MNAQRESNRRKQEGSILFLFPPKSLFLSLFLSNEENITDIAAEEIVGTIFSKHILKHLENCEKRQQEKLRP